MIRYEIFTSLTDHIKKKKIEQEKSTRNTNAEWLAINWRGSTGFIFFSTIYIIILSRIYPTPIISYGNIFYCCCKM